MRHRLWFVLVLSLSQFGCGLATSLLSDTARYQFSAQNSCPEERMTLKAVPVRARDLLVIDGDPPRAVAADPGRLAVWRATVRDNVDIYMNLTAIRVTGCDVDRTYLCWIEDVPHSDELNYFCEELDLSNSNSRLGQFTLDANLAQALREQLATP